MALAAVATRMAPAAHRTASRSRSGPIHHPSAGRFRPHARIHRSVTGWPTRRVHCAQTKVVKTNSGCGRWTRPRHVRSRELSAPLTRAGRPMVDTSAFASNRQISRIRIDTNRVESVAEVESGGINGIAWAPDGTLVFALNLGGLPACPGCRWHAGAVHDARPGPEGDAPLLSRDPARWSPCPVRGDQRAARDCGCLGGGSRQPDGSPPGVFRSVAGPLFSATPDLLPSAKPDGATLRPGIAHGHR